MERFPRKFIFYSEQVNTMYRKSQTYVIKPLLLCMLVLWTACASSDAGSAQVTGLSGSQWQLVELPQLGDDPNTTKPDNPLKYTMTLQPDGKLDLHLNCNQGSAEWLADPIHGERGTFTIGPVVMTRMACPPPTYDARIAMELEHVTSYSIQDGRLYLRLADDEGAYIWEPFEALAQR